MVLATLLQIPSVRKPLRRLSRKAPNVSAVSPLWLMAKTSVLPLMGVLRWRNSLAYSTSTGILASCSIRYSLTRAACNAVPHPVSTTRETSRNSAAVTFKPPSLAVHSSVFSRPRMASRTECGCSKISLSM